MLGALTPSRRSTRTVIRTLTVRVYRGVERVELVVRVD